MSSCCAPQNPKSSKRTDQSAARSEGRSSLSREDRRFDGSIDEMVLVDAGEYRIGTDDTLGFPADGEGPSRIIAVSPFYISKGSVTNAEFAAFTQATLYRTEAERFGWSFVFHSHVPKVLLKRGKARSVAGLAWWLAVDGASWSKPEGPGSTYRNRMDYPAVHITWNDAMAYCQWAGCRLPTEAEWEVAARGGMESKTYVWGNDFMPKGSFRCNTWQGDFPDVDTGEDGYAGTCPTKAFAPNGYGLYNMAGNVWEWCLDWFSPP